MKNLLTVRNLSKKYSNSLKPALTKVNFKISEGEMVAVVGPSGAGKSTLLRCINRLIEPSEGSVSFQDKNISLIHGYELRKYRTQIGFIFQNYNLQNRLSVLDNVLTGLLGQRPSITTTLGLWPKKDILTAKNILKDLGLEAYLYKRADMLSGGEQQRVSIARARIQNPKLILADEPVASLDPPTAKKVLEDLKKICKKENIAILINLHDVDMALKYADRILGLSSGKKVWDEKVGKTTKKSFEKIYLKK